MLFAHPQSVIKLFFSAIKTSTDLFVSMLPISIIWITMKIMVNFSLIFSERFSWTIYFAILFSILGLFCLCWSMCYVYEKLTNSKTDLKHALMTVLKKFWRMFFILITFLSVLVLFILVFSFLDTVLIKEKAPAWVTHVILISAGCLAGFFIVGFNITYVLETLVKNRDFLSTLQQSFKMFFQPSAMWRFFTSFVLLMLSFLLIAVMVLGLFSAMLALNLNLTIAASILGIITVPCILFFSTLQAVTFVCLYNDLSSRS